MSRQPIILRWLSMGLLLLPLACSKGKIPENLRGIPADADIVATVDAHAVLSYAKQVADRLIPADMKDKLPTFQALGQRVLQMVGIDLSKIQKITYIGYLNSQEKMAFVVEGIQVQGLKGTPKGNHNGVALFELPSHIFFAEVPKIGVVVGPSVDMVQRILDSYSGKTRCIAEGDRAEIFKELLAADGNLDQLRLYLLSGSIPGAPPPFPMRGGGFFFHLDRGVAGAVFSNEKSAKELKSNFEIFKLAIQVAVATGGSIPGVEELGAKLDEETKKLATDLINGVQARQSGGTFTVSYQGDMKPMIEKALSLGIHALKADEEVLREVLSTPVEAPAEPEAPAKGASEQPPQAP